MIYDLYQNKGIYTAMGKSFEEAFAFIARAEKENLEPGKYEVDGDRIYAAISEYDTKTEFVFEAHKKYMDVQYVVDGHEEIYVNNIENCVVKSEYNAEKDCGFFEGKAKTVVDMPKGAFCVLFPDDAHAPGIAYDGKVSSVKKIVVKIRID